MSKARRHRGAERGFTIIEAMVAISLSAIVLLSVYMMMNEGLSITVETLDAQDFDRSMNNTMLRFSTDIRGAEYFYAGLESAPDPDDGEVLDNTPLLNEITFTNRRNDGTLAWIKYLLYVGPLSEDTYLVRLSDLEDPSKMRLTYVADDIANFNFLYFDDEDLHTSKLTDVTAVGLRISFDSDTGSKEREFYFRLRNGNKGLMSPPWNFEDELDAQIVK